MKWKSTRRPKVNKNGKRTIWKYAQADFAKARFLIDDLVLQLGYYEEMYNVRLKDRGWQRAAETLDHSGSEKEWWEANLYT